MADPTFNTGATIALVFITGFAIQQVLTIADPFVNGSIQRLKNPDKPKPLPGGMNETDFKKAVMALLAFLLGAVTVCLTKIQLLGLLDPKYAGGWGDFLVTALVLGSGTEAVNTVIKYIGYVKDARKPAASVEVAVTPASARMKVSEALQFTATVKNAANEVVEWSVVQPAGGSIAPNGLYTAGTQPGTYQVKATSKADGTKFGIATVTVT